MLNKKSEIILRYLISNKHDEGQLFDFADIQKILPGCSKTLINSLLKTLGEEAYIQAVQKDGGDVVLIVLRPKGECYFENKRIEILKYWMPIILSNAIAFAALINSMLARLGI